MLDLAALGVAYATTRNPKGWAGVTAFVVGALGLDVLVASKACQELAQSNRASEAARQRVRPTQAMPDGRAKQREEQKQPELATHGN
jgi:hypothetical protein